MLWHELTVKQLPSSLLLPWLLEMKETAVTTSSNQLPSMLYGQPSRSCQWASGTACVLLLSLFINCSVIVSPTFCSTFLSTLTLQQKQHATNTRNLQQGQHTISNAGPTKGVVGESYSQTWQPPPALSSPKRRTFLIKDSQTWQLPPALSSPKHRASLARATVRHVSYLLLFLTLNKGRLWWGLWSDMTDTSCSFFPKTWGIFGVWWGLQSDTSCSFFSWWGLVRYVNHLLLFLPINTGCLWWRLQSRHVSHLQLFLPLNAGHLWSGLQSNISATSCSSFL